VFLKRLEGSNSVRERWPGSDLTAEVLGFFIRRFWEIEGKSEGFIGLGEEFVILEGGLAGLKLAFKDSEGSQSEELVSCVGVWCWEPGDE